MVQQTYRCEEEAAELHGERRALTEKLIQGLRLRTSTSSTDAAGPAQSYVQHGPRPPLSDSSSTTAGDVGVYQGYSRPGGVWTLDHRGRWPLEGDTLPRTAVAGEAPPPLQLPAPPRDQRRPSRQSTSLAHLARITDSSADTATTPVAAEYLHHLGRHSDGSSAMTPSSSSSVLEVKPSPSWYADDDGSGGVGGGYGGTDDYRYHRRGFRCDPRWSSYPGARSPLGGHAAPRSVEASRDQHRDRTERDGERGDPGAPPLKRWLQQAQDERSYHQHPSMSAPMGGKRKFDPADGGVAVIIEHSPPAPVADAGRGYQHGAPPWAAAAAGAPLRSASGSRRYRETDSPPSALLQLREGGHGGVVSPLCDEERAAGGIDAPASSSLGARDPHWEWHTAAEAAVAMTRLSPPPSWDLGSGGRSGAEAVPSEGGGSLASIGLGGDRRSVSVSDRSCGPRAYTGLDYGREFVYHDDWSHRGSPARGQHRRRSSHQQQDHRSPLASAFLRAGTAAVVLPRLGRGRSDPGPRGAGWRPLLPGVADSGRSSYPLPGLAEVVASAGGQAATGGCESYNFVHGGSARFAGSVGGDGGGTAVGDAGAATADGGGRKRQRLSDPTTPMGSSTCMEEGCDQRPRYACKGSMRPAYCSSHKPLGTVDTRHPQCKDAECTTQPSFGLEGDRRPSYCAKHRLAGMINVARRPCRQSGCLRSPNFGFQGDRRASYCKGHRETGMVDIVSRRCREDLCTSRPVYSMKGMRPVSCSKHKLPGMIDVVSARCREPGCLRHPSFGYASDKKALRCARHRLENMEALKGRRHLKSRE